MTKKLLPILAILFLLINAPVFASNNKNDRREEDSKLHITIKSEKSQKHEESSEEHKSDKFKIEEDDNEFEISGEISSVSSQSFVIGGQTINIDPSKVEKLKIKGILEAGNKAKVKGIILNGSRYAEEIKLIGTGQGRFKFEIKNDDASPSASPQASSSATITPTPEATATSNLSGNVKIKAVGSVEKVVKFFQQILGFLTGSTNSPSPTPTPSPSVSPQVSPTPSASPTPTISPSPTPLPSPTPEATESAQVSPSPTPTVSPSPIAENHVNIKLGPSPVEAIIGTLESLISALQNLL